MASVYKRLNWGPNEQILTQKLNDMIGNDDWLYQNQITGFYSALGILRDSGLSVRAGYVKLITSEDTRVTMATYYERPFMPGARPVIITGIASSGYMAMFTAVRGLDGREVPDHRGFNLIVSQYRDVPHTKFDGHQYVSYLAIAPNG